MDIWGELLAIGVSFVGMLFLYAGITKAASLSRFVQALRLVPHLPHQLARPVGVIVACVETLAGALVLADVFSAKVLVIGLLCLFSVVAIVARSKRQQVPCNCFGVGDSEYLSPATAVRNMILVAVVAVSFSTSSAFIPPLTQIYAAIVFLLFLTVRLTVRNQTEFFGLRKTGQL